MVDTAVVAEVEAIAVVGPHGSGAKAAGSARRRGVHHAGVRCPKELQPIYERVDHENVLAVGGERDEEHIVA